MSDSPSRPDPAPPTRGYFADSEKPLAALLFLLPMLVFYEVGTGRWARDPATLGERRIIAFNLLRQFFGWTVQTAGALSGNPAPPMGGPLMRWLPAAAVVAVLVGWHLARRDRWKIRPALLPTMAAESVLLAAPLVALGLLAAMHLPLNLPAQAAVAAADRPALLVMAVGAGVYEELVFRLVGFAVLHFVLVDLLGFGRKPGAILTVAASAVLFSAYHYLGREQFDPQTFAFRTAAGVWFGAIFLTRGFGLTAGAHAAYDLLIVAVAWADAGKLS